MLIINTKVKEEEKKRKYHVCVYFFCSSEMQYFELNKSIERERKRQILK
jgi:hypothetical protein